MSVTHAIAEKTARAACARIEFRRSRMRNNMTKDCPPPLERASGEKDLQSAATAPGAREKVTDHFL
jgi:hypothetical protein